MVKIPLLSGSETKTCIYCEMNTCLLSLVNPVSSDQNKHLPNTVLVLPEVMVAGVLLNWSPDCIYLAFFYHFTSSVWEIIACRFGTLIMQSWRTWTGNHIYYMVHFCCIHSAVKQEILDRIYCDILLIDLR